MDSRWHEKSHHACWAVSFSTICSADYDGDGDLDLFIAGRCKPGAYPEPVHSVLLQNNDGVYSPDKTQSAAIKNLNSISGAMWTNLIGDHLPELVLACDPGPIRVFAHEGGELIDTTTRLGLSEYVGFWNSVTSGDFNGDGKLDLLCGNLGTNSRYEIHRLNGLVWYHGDISGSGMNDVFESYKVKRNSNSVPIRPRNEVLRAIPFLGELFTTYNSFASANSKQILGTQFNGLGQVQITKLESVIFESWRFI